MIKFSEMGQLNYIEKYKIDKDTKLISEYTAGINNIEDKFFNVIIHTQKYIENKEEFYETSVQLTDINGKFMKMEFRSHYIMRLDHYMEHIDRLYRSKVNKEAPQLDYNKYTWYNSTMKTENEYKIGLGYIKTNNPKDPTETSYVYISIDKQNGAVKCGNDITIRSINVDGETITFENKPPIEIFTITNNGMIHFYDQNISHVYYDKFGVYNFIKYHNLYIPENNFLSNIHPCHMLHNKMTITYTDGHSETFDIDYDEFGIYSENSFKDPYRLPVIYERYVNENNEFEEVNSLHPLHIDHSNLQITHNDKLYAMDRFIYQDDFTTDHEKYAEFIREVRKLTDDEIKSIAVSLDEFVCGDPPILYIENFESIIEESLHNKI